MAPRLNQMFSLALVAGVGVYTGVRFFEPMVIEQLEKDGNLRKDIAVPKYDSEGELIGPDGLTDSQRWEMVRKENNIPSLTDIIKKEEANSTNPDTKKAA
ncbi:BA75_02441T0 [Komagataella pastoris]|uniref:BA75_02441T0 n=1 Tax=Komagataella pastoris TaxID=4922 RepID=A0A1B2JAT5_PICPA|nr:BA75_02441T0 [Komagataella pastoris]